MATLGALCCSSTILQAHAPLCHEDRQHLTDSIKVILFQLINRITAITKVMSIRENMYAELKFKVNNLTNWDLTYLKVAIKFLVTNLSVCVLKVNFSFALFPKESIFHNPMPFVTNEKMKTGFLL